ncbi:MAG: SIMPL domain-containing protein [Patescibacteria group bacterium]
MLNNFLGEDGAKRVTQWIVFTLVFLSLFLVVKVLGDFKRLPNIGKEVYPQSTIMVSGTGEALAIPDIATFSFSVTETAVTVKGAQEKATQKINAALAVVKEAGVEDKDIQTSNYNVYPKYEYSSAVCPRPLSPTISSDGSISSSVAMYCPPGKQILTGYEVDQTITVKVRKIEIVGDLVTKVGVAKVSNISGVQFEVDKREQFISEARNKAIKDAREKAKELAKQLGVRLGDIISYNDNGNYPVFYGAMGKGGDMMSASSAPAPVQLPQGETKITSNVSITYEIK